MCSSASAQTLFTYWQHVIMSLFQSSQFQTKQNYHNLPLIFQENLSSYYFIRDGYKPPVHAKIRSYAASAHKRVYEKAELQAASLSPKHHAAHRQGEELTCSSWSSLGISQHSPGQIMTPVRFVAGQGRWLLLTWQKAGAREMYSQC